MKIFNWVHRKFGQNNDKDSGHSLHDRVAEEQLESNYERAGYGSRGSIDARKSSHSARRMSPSPKEKDIIDDHKLLIHRHSTLTLTTATAFQQVEEAAGEYWLSVGSENGTDEQVRRVISRGLLAIGTFGLERVDEVEEEGEVRNLVERVDSDLTAGDVELFHDELEKVFGLKNHQLDPMLGYAGNTESPSLSPLHGNSSSVHDLYPLHQFFFNSSKADINNHHHHYKRKDQSAPRTSLRDLFSATTTTKREDQQGAIKSSDSKGSKYNVKKSGWSLSSFVKKVVKGKTHTTDSRCKVEKVMQGLFHRKIYPDTDTDTAVPHRKKKCSKLTSCIIPPKLNDDHDHSIYTANTTSDPELVCSPGLCTAHEHWINTDADYVVLEF